jgi:hypothetical protein
MIQSNCLSGKEYRYRQYNASAIHWFRHGTSGPQGRFECDEPALRVGLRRIPLTILDDSYRKTCALGTLLKHSTCILWQTLQRAPLVGRHGAASSLGACEPKINAGNSLCAAASPTRSHKGRRPTPLQLCVHKSGFLCNAWTTVHSPTGDAIHAHSEPRP